MGYALGFLSGLQLSAGGQPQIAGISSLEYLARSLVTEVGGRIVLFLPATRTTGYVVFSDGGDLLTKAFDVTGNDAETFLLDQKKANWILVGEWELIMAWANAHQIESIRAIQGRDSAVSESL
jgi:tRNA A37 threonylcarbamoyladenosine modification protein TsaB